MCCAARTSFAARPLRLAWSCVHLLPCVRCSRDLNDGSAPQCVQARQGGDLDLRKLQIRLCLPCSCPLHEQQKSHIPESAWDRAGTICMCLGQGWHNLQPPLDRPARVHGGQGTWRVHGGQGTWRVHGGQGTLRVHGGYMEGTWRVHGGYMEGTWRVHGGYMEARVHGGYMEARVHGGQEGALECPSDSVCFGPCTN